MPNQSRAEIVIRLPLLPETGRGRLALGRKKSDLPFTREDLELVLAMAGELSLNLERLRLQEDVIYERASKEKLDELNKLKTEFISSVSHELRTPMSSIQGLAEILQAGKFKTRDERERYLNLMIAESGRLRRFLRNVLDFGRIERQTKTYDFRLTDVRPVVEEAVDILRAALEEQGFLVKLEMPDHAVELKIDPDAVKQAVTNLVDNAMRYSKPGTTIDIQIVEGEAVDILVKDKGIGIPPEELPLIFDNFFRGAAASRLSSQGTGLGLKISKHIMEAHGGEIRVESVSGQGSIFRLRFPRP